MSRDRQDDYNQSHKKSSKGFQLNVKLEIFKEEEDLCIENDVDKVEKNHQEVRVKHRWVQPVAVSVAAMAIWASIEKLVPFLLTMF